MSAAIEIVAPATPATRRTNMSDIDRALDDVSASSAGGAPFLIAFGFTLAACGVLGLVVPLRTAAIITLFQGNLALPLAFLLERRLGTRRMAADHPLKPLALQMAMSQIVALPAVLLAFSLHPAYVPAAMAAIGGGHFLPYAWLQRTRIYVVLGVAVSVGAMVLSLALKREAFSPVLFYISACYAVAAPLLLRHARRITARAGAPA
jgi:hypothetical protein